MSSRGRAKRPRPFLDSFSLRWTALDRRFMRSLQIPFPGDRMPIRHIRFSWPARGCPFPLCAGRRQPPFFPSCRRLLVLLGISSIFSGEHLPFYNYISLSYDVERVSVPRRWRAAESSLLHFGRETPRRTAPSLPVAVMWSKFPPTRRGKLTSELTIPLVYFFFSARDRAK